MHYIYTYIHITFKWWEKKTGVLLVHCEWYAIRYFSSIGLVQSAATTTASAAAEASTAWNPFNGRRFVFLFFFPHLCLHYSQPLIYPFLLTVLFIFFFFVSSYSYYTPLASFDAAATTANSNSSHLHHWLPLSAIYYSNFTDINI